MMLLCQAALLEKKNIEAKITKLSNEASASSAKKYGAGTNGQVQNEKNSLLCNFIETLLIMFQQ